MDSVGLIVEPLHSDISPLNKADPVPSLLINGNRNGVKKYPSLVDHPILSNRNNLQTNDIPLELENQSEGKVQKVGKVQRTKPNPKQQPNKKELPNFELSALKFLKHSLFLLKSRRRAIYTDALPLRDPRADAIKALKEKRMIAIEKKKKKT